MTQMYRSQHTQSVSMVFKQNNRKKWCIGKTNRKVFFSVLFILKVLHLVFRYTMYCNTKWEKRLMWDKMFGSTTFCLGNTVREL